VQTFVLALVLLTVPAHLFAQEKGLTFTVTPPLFQLNLKPGDTWTSGIQIVNSNSYDLTVYAEPYLFEPAGESGAPRFTRPPGEEIGPTGKDASTLAGWMTLPAGPIEVPREQTRTIPIAITIPKDAAPGGHYAAVLIGNRAPEGVHNGDALSVTSSIASLFFLRVAGTVIEKGRIRDFTTESSVYQDAEARLSLRFENQGNVHLQPKGNITIYNMFGKQRGFIPLNSGAYGNVLPGSIRKFMFTWKSDSGLWDIGRYRAEATLGYGWKAQQFAQATTYFYVLPLVPLAEVVGGTLAFLLLFGWAVRAYIRRALSLEAARLPHIEVEGIPPEVPHTALNETAAPRPRLKIATLIRPIQEGIVDLRQVGSSQPALSPSRASDAAAQTGGLRAFLHRYRKFFLFVALVVVGWFAVSAFLRDVLTRERGYNVTVEHPDDVSVPLKDSAIAP